MPGKRHNESGQIRKEEYDLMERSSSEPDGGMQRASKAAMAKRKIIKVRRPTATPEAKKAMESMGPSSSSGKGLFGGINLVASGNAVPFSFGASSTGKTTASAAAASSSAASARPPINITTKINSETKSLSKLDADKKLLAEAWKAQDKTFIKSWQEGDPGMADQSKVMWQYLYYRYGKQAEFNKKHLKARAKKSISMPPGTKSSSTPETKTTEKPTESFSFTAPKDTKSPAAPAQSTFSFGAASPAPAPGNTVALSFGGSSSGGFSFNPNPTAAIAKDTTTPSAFTGSATTSDATPPSSTTNNDENGAGGETSNDDDKKDAVEKRVDPNWDTLESFEPVAFFASKKKPSDNSFGPPTNIAKGVLNLEKMKTDPKTIRMVMRNDLGIKVLVNIRISSDMNFTTTTSKTKKGQSWWWIMFIGCNYTDENKTKKDFGMFRIKSDEKVSKALLSKLTELASQTA